MGYEVLDIRDEDLELGGAGDVVCDACSRIASGLA
jgi:hypothetical protein